MKSPDDDDRFAIRPEVDAPVHANSTSSFAELLEVEPAIEEPDLQLGGGAAQAIYDALQHFTDDDVALPSMDAGVMLAQGGAPQSGPLAQGTALPTSALAPKKSATRKAAAAKKAAPTKERDDWDKIEATTDNKPGGYDIQWTKQLDPRVLKSIDGAYADDIADAAVAKRVKGDKKIAQIERDRKKAIGAIRTPTRRRRRRARRRSSQILSSTVSLPPGMLSVRSASSRSGPNSRTTQPSMRPRRASQSREKESARFVAPICRRESARTT